MAENKGFDPPLPLLNAYWLLWDYRNDIGRLVRIEPNYYGIKIIDFCQIRKLTLLGLLAYLIKGRQIIHSFD